MPYDVEFIADPLWHFIQLFFHFLIEMSRTSSHFRRTYKRADVIKNVNIHVILLKNTNNKNIVLLSAC